MNWSAVEWFVHLGELGTMTGDSREEKLNKASLTLVVLPFIFVGLLWGALYWALGYKFSGLIPGCYGVLSLASLLTFFLTKRFNLFRFSQLLLILLLPFCLQWSLGGFYSASVVMVWAILCPIGALTFAGTQQAMRWCVAYLVLTIVSGFIDPYLPTLEPSMPPLMIRAFLVMNITAVSCFIFFPLRHFISENQSEHARAENLLLNILPAAIAERLKKDSASIADGYSDATILFADIVNFTGLSSQISPKELVGFLDEVFSRFDDLAERHHLEKIKTIGDAYMVAAGIPIPRKDHAHAIAAMALDMLETLRGLRTPTGEPVNVRIGLNSGPVVAGVIGKKKFIYDLWGDAVNTASRMESHGIGGEIQVSEDTYNLIQNDFVFEKRGEIDVKGKGRLVTYMLKTRK